MIEVIVNDRLGKKVRIKANPTDTVGDFKKLVAAQTGTRYSVDQGSAGTHRSSLMIKTLKIHGNPVIHLVPVDFPRVIVLRRSVGNDSAGLCRPSSDL